MKQINQFDAHPQFSLIGSIAVSYSHEVAVKNPYPILENLKYIPPFEANELLRKMHICAIHGRVLRNQHHAA